jgi:hypothetical protein
MALTQKLNRTSNPTSGYKPKRMESWDWRRYLYTCVQSSIMNKSKGGSNPRVHGQKTSKQTRADTINGVLVNLKKEENSDTCYGMDGP